MVQRPKPFLLLQRAGGVRLGRKNGHWQQFSPNYRGTRVLQSLPDRGGESGTRRSRIPACLAPSHTAARSGRLRASLSERGVVASGRCGTTPLTSARSAADLTAISASCGSNYPPAYLWSSSITLSNGKAFR